MTTFNVGDKVQCIRDSNVASEFNLPFDIIYTVSSTQGIDTIFLLGKKQGFDKDRFVHADKEYANLSPIILKIRQLEKRFQATR